jgi:hypothetical protein
MTWLSDLSSRLMGRARRGHLAAFGKHPGWDDHLDDIGLDTKALLAAKQYLYIHGIGGAIDAGRWENRPEGEVLTQFKHVFIWTAGSDLLVGRIWSSRDGKNRTLYPMVLCAHFKNAEFDSVVPLVYEALAQWESECRATSSADDVRRIVRDGQESIQEFLAVGSLVSDLDPAFTRHFEFASGTETLPRLAYALDTYLGAFGPGKVNRRELALTLALGQTKLVPQHLRLPANTADTFGTLRYWRQVLNGLVDEAVPALIVAPDGAPWADLIVGPVTTQHLGCLKLTPLGLPLTSDVPFAIGQSAFLRSEEIFDGLRAK